MRIVFFGSVELSERLLRTTLKCPDAEVIAVATKSKSVFNADHVDLSPIADDYGIASRYVKDMNTENNIKWLQELSPDIIYCFGWSALVGAQVLNLPPLGVLGFHPAQLPMNRGRHPIVWALARGLEVTASTFFFMDKGADSGDIISQKDVNIDSDDTARSLYDRIAAVAEHQVAEFTQALVDGKVKRVKQVSQNANYWRKRGKSDGLIDFRMSSKAIFNLVRALSKPYIGSHVTMNGKDYKIWKVSIGPDCSQNHEPGKVLGLDGNSILVKTDDGSVVLEEHEIRPIPAVNDYLL